MSEAFPGKYVKVMADYCADPVWLKGSNGNLDDLPISSCLRDRLRGWALFYDAFCQDYVPSEDREKPPFPEKAFSDIGAFLARKLKQELGNEWTVEYRAEDTGETYLIEDGGR